MRPCARTLRALTAAASIFAALAGAGCRGCDAPARDLPAGAATSAAPAPTSDAPPARELVHIIGALRGCDLEHRGLLFDAGANALLGRIAWQGDVLAGIHSIEHDGSTWARVAERRIKLAFVLPEASPIFVSLRAVGLVARRAAVTLDGHLLGTVRFQRDQIRITSTPTTSLPADAGPHTLAIRFSGRARDGEAFADLDWIRIGVPDDDPTTYGAPTLRDVIAPAAALSGVPHRAVSLRAPGSVRCAFRVRRTTRLRSSVGLLGRGEGHAEVRVVRDGVPPVVVYSAQVAGGDKATWIEADVPLEAFAGQIVSLELRATETARGARVLFGDPALVGPPEPPPPVPRARAVVLVAIDGVERDDLPPWSGQADPRLPTLSELAATATTFDQHRAPSTVVSTVIASLLTGLPPNAHTVTDVNARLPERVVTIGAVARDSSVRTAMFTGVPSTFQAFGFGSKWGKFVEHPPTSGATATTPIDEASAWVTETAREGPSARLLAFIHAQGGHPPWEVSPKELAALKPADYSGPIDPRRAGQTLARVRTSRRRAAALSADDRDRIRDLSSISLGAQDRALGGLIAALKTAGLWDETLLIVTGDVSSGRSDAALYGDGLELAEPLLTLPLYVHFPGDLHAGRHIDEPTEIIDIPRTALAALGLSISMPQNAGAASVASRGPLGKDLAAVASGLAGLERDPQVATLGDRYSARWGDLVLTGSLGAPPFLCDLALDPTCAFNRRDVMPLATIAVFRRTLSLDESVRAPIAQREPATIDQETAAQLNVWGAQ